MGQKTTMGVAMDEACDAWAPSIKQGDQRLLAKPSMLNAQYR